MKVNFGLQLPTWAFFSYDENVKLAVLAENAGFNYICVPDHFFLRDRNYLMFKVTNEKCDPTRPDMFDPWVMLSAVAARTKNIQLGPGVTPTPYYNPARLAKIIVSLDHVSHGRLILGVGAGWHHIEAKSYNLPWNNYTTRIDMMNEGIELMKKLWTIDKRVTWRGKYYEVYNAPAWPKPLQKPYPPIWYGGSGKQIIEATGKSGDGWCPYIADNITPKVYKEKWKKIMESAKTRGRDPHTITPSSHIIMSMEKSYDRAYQKYIASMRTFLGRNLTDEELNHGIFGTPDDCINKLEEYTKAGVSHFVLNPYPHPDNVNVWFKTFSKQIIPYFNLA